MKQKENAPFLLGVLICFAVAEAAVLLERLIPGDILGALIISLFMGTGIRCSWFGVWTYKSFQNYRECIDTATMRWYNSCNFITNR